MSQVILHICLHHHVVVLNLRCRRSCHNANENLRNDSVEHFADLFTIVLRNVDIQEFDSKWDGILFSMTKIPLDDILEGFYKLRIRESEKLKKDRIGNCMTWRFIRRK